MVLSETKICNMCKLKVQSLLASSNLVRLKLAFRSFPKLNHSGKEGSATETEIHSVAATHQWLKPDKRLQSKVELFRTTTQTSY